MRKRCLFGIFSIIIALFCIFIPQSINVIAFAKNEKCELTSAKGMCVMEASSNRVLYEKDSSLKLPMASTTKIITAITVIEKVQNLDEICTIPFSAQGVSGSSIYLKANEHMSYRELLYGLMLKSGNDAAVALAILTYDNIENFAKHANLLCAKIGAKNTNMVTPNGLHDDKHYTTAYDLSLISSYALKNKTFAEIVSTKDKIISNELKVNKNDKRHLKNNNKLLKKYEGCDGVKTGYTLRAGRCYVGSATKNGMQIVCTLLNCNPMFEECEKLFDMAFEEYKIYNILEAHNHLGSYGVINSDTKSVNVLSKEAFSYPLKREELANVEIRNNLPADIRAPFKSNQEVGCTEIYLSKHLIFSTNIYTMEGVDSNSYLDYLSRILQRM
ncbi:MAG: D-alanyl-D-alanine carboxypeptidase family protein [Clostridia bacterium]